MSDTNNEDQKALSTEVIESFEGKEIGGHPFFKVDLRDIIRKDVKINHPGLTEAEIEEIAQNQFAIGGYSGVKVPSYYRNNGVYLLLEPVPQSEAGYRAYIGTFPSEQQFKHLKSVNSALNKYETVGDYLDEIVSKFALPIGAKYDPRNEEMYERREMFVPFSQYGIGDVVIQTPLSGMVDKMVTKMSQR